MNSNRKYNLLSNYVGLALISIGIISTAVSIDYENSIAALVGLTLILWGGIITYIRPERHIRLDVIQQILKDLNSNQVSLLSDLHILNGTSDPIYFSHGSFDEIGEVKITFKTPKHETQITPPGFSLHKLVERELGFNLSSTSLTESSKIIEKILTEELDLAKSILIENMGNLVKVTIDDNVFLQNDDFANATNNNKIGDPLTSAIACIILRSTGNQVIIQEITKNEKNKMVAVLKIIN